jgi:hypothetical protein
MGLAPVVISVRDRTEIKPAIEAFGNEGSGGLILPPDVLMLAHRLNRVPLIAAEREFVRHGGFHLLSSLARTR